MIKYFFIIEIKNVEMQMYFYFCFFFKKLILKIFIDATACGNNKLLLASCCGQNIAAQPSN